MYTMYRIWTKPGALDTQPVLATRADSSRRRAPMTLTEGIDNDDRR